jgi:hypothetical protein
VLPSFNFPQLDFVKPSNGFHPVTWERVNEAVNVNQLLDDLFQMPEEEHEGERVASLASDHNVKGMEVVGMV